MLYSNNNCATPPFHANSLPNIAGEQISCLAGGYLYPPVVDDFNLPTTSFSNNNNASNTVLQHNSSAVSTNCNMPTIPFDAWNASSMMCGFPSNLLASASMDAFSSFPSFSAAVVSNSNANLAQNCDENSFLGKENISGCNLHGPTSTSTQFITTNKRPANPFPGNEKPLESEPRIALRAINMNCQAPPASATGEARLLKDEKYWERRLKNNEAAKHSRSKRRDRENQLRMQVAELEAENKRLRKELNELIGKSQKLK